MEPPVVNPEAVTASPTSSTPNVGVVTVTASCTAAGSVETASVAESNGAVPCNVSGNGSGSRRKRKPHKEGDVLGSLQSIASTIIIAVFVIAFIVQAFQIPSESMENTLLIGDYLLVDKVHYGPVGKWSGILPYSDVRRGDIIVFRYPVHPEQHFVKRVIGLPGDRIRMNEKHVSVNGKPLDERYVVNRLPSRDAYRDDFPRTDLLNSNVEANWWVQMRSLVHHGELVVPKGQYFVLGDNRDESLDSRYWGMVPRENIIGRPLVIYWSMQHPERLGQFAESTSDKLLYFVYRLTHVFEQARWRRAFRLIQ